MTVVILSPVMGSTTTFVYLLLVLPSIPVLTYPFSWEMSSLFIIFYYCFFFNYKFRNCKSYFNFVYFRNWRKLSNEIKFKINFIAILSLYLLRIFTIKMFFMPRSQKKINLKFYQIFIPGSLTFFKVNIKSNSMR